MNWFHRAFLTSLAARGSGGGGSPNLEAAVLALSPVAYYKLDDAGPTFIDSSGNGRDGVGTNVTAQGQAGPGGSYAVFGTAGSQVSIADNDAFSGGPKSFVFLARAGTLDTQNTIIQKGLTATYTLCEWAIDSTNVDGRVALSVLRANGAVVVRRETAAAGGITANTWRLIVVTVNTMGSHLATVHLYRDGTNVNGTNSQGANTSANLGGAVLIGNRTDVAGYQFNGALAHMAIINSELSAGQVTALAAAAATDGWI